MEEQEDEEHKKKDASAAGAVNQIQCESKTGNTDGNVKQQDPLTRCLSCKESYQNIRALPRAPGESIAFTHRILHWGSKGNKNCTNAPRIAISFVCSDPSFEKPYLKNYEKHWKNYSSSSSKGIVLPPFEIRLLLVCAQLLIYYQRFDLPKDTIRACYDYCKEFKDELDPTYWKKVSLEFVQAMRECEKSLESEINGDRNKVKVDIGGGGDENEDNDDDDDDDDDDAMLEAMLENADEAEDDFDDMEDDEEGGNPISEVGNDESDFDGFDEDEECNLFGRKSDEPPISGAGNDESDFDGSDEDEECNHFGRESDEPQKKKLKF